MSGSVGPGGWWSWPLAVGLTALIPASVWSGWTLFGPASLTVAGAACLLLLVALWWDDLAPRISWNEDGFVARGARGMHRGTWSDARSVFVAAGHRLVVVTPSGRFDVRPDRFGWRGQRARVALEAMRAARATSPATPLDPLESTIDLGGREAPPGPRLDSLPRLASPLVQFGLVLALWATGMGLALFAGP
jgi:hypothetical protein